MVGNRGADQGSRSRPAVRGRVFMGRSESPGGAGAPGERCGRWELEGGLHLENRLPRRPGGLAVVAHAVDDAGAVADGEGVAPVAGIWVPDGRTDGDGDGGGLGAEARPLRPPAMLGVRGKAQGVGGSVPKGEGEDGTGRWGVPPFLHLGDERSCVLRRWRVPRGADEDGILDLYFGFNLILWDIHHTLLGWGNI